MIKYTTQCTHCGEILNEAVEFSFGWIEHTENQTNEEAMDNYKKNIACPHCGGEHTIQLEAKITVKQPSVLSPFALHLKKNKMGEMERYIQELCDKSNSAWFHKDEIEGIINGWMEIQRGQRKEAA